VSSWIDLDPSHPLQEFYISIKYNSKNYEPGSQQKRNPYEADSGIGRVIEGMDDKVPRINRYMMMNKIYNICI
jgi:hypothetical protein